MKSAPLHTYYNKEVPSEINIENKICIKCNLQRPNIKYWFGAQRNGDTTNICRPCNSEESKLFRIDNKEELKIKRHEYYLSVKNEPWFIAQEKEKNEKLRQKRISEGKRSPKEYNGKLLHSTFTFASIGTYIKDKVNCRYLDYPILNLIKHLESQFEPWMNWDNWGIYSARKWDDNDQSTWIWQIDHIIPKADLPYTSPEDENFKICWSLNNLRPLIAKQNIIDGASRVRHTKERVRIVKVHVPKFTEEQVQEVKTLYESGMGSRKIADKMNISREKVTKIYEKLGYKNVFREGIRKKPLPEFKVCKVCKEEKSILEYRIEINKCGNQQAEPNCKECEKFINQLRNLTKYHGKQEEYKEVIKSKDLVKIKEALVEFDKTKYERLNPENDHSINFKVRSFIQRNLHKDVECKYSGLKTKELRNLLDSQFEEGINWDNHGIKWVIGHKEQFTDPVKYWNISNITINIKT